MSSPPPDENVKAIAKAREWHNVVRAAHAFANQRINPTITKAIEAKPPDVKKLEALAQCYQRLYLLASSLILMNHVRHHQSLAITARAMLELAIDISLLASDPTNQSVERFVAYGTVEKFEHAKKCVEFHDTHASHPELRMGNMQHLRQHINDASKIAERDRLVQLWGGKKAPMHWTGIRTVSERAGKAGFRYQQWYTQMYGMLSWYTHSGVTGYTPKVEHYYHQLVGGAYVFGVEFFRDGLRHLIVSARLTDIDKAILTDLDNLTYSQGRLPDTYMPRFA